jgi:2-dehydro-3-deoxy-D-gluconate 5-dehydrogenase
MLRRGAGKVVFVASMLSFHGGINVPGYTASKSGLVGLTRALANERAGATYQDTRHPGLRPPLVR